jgi:hypothetical protein
MQIIHTWKRARIHLYSESRILNVLPTADAVCYVRQLDSAVTGQDTDGTDCYTVGADGS